jgi:hypothetical protein
VTRLDATARLWWLLRRRTSSGPRDPGRLTTTLAVAAFGTTTAILLVVVGGYEAFVRRASEATGMGLGAQLDQPTTSDATQYPLLAGIAALLLLVPLATLGGAAARLAAARRDARLAALRLAGATTGQVTLLTAFDSATQALSGALAGIGGYLALLPLVSRLRFQGRAFGLGELWVGPVVLLAAVAGVVLVALVSALASLRRVAITPLGVAARATPPALRWTRLLPLLVAMVAMAVAVNTPWRSAAVVAAVLLTVLLIGFAAIGVVGPFAMGVAGRVTAKHTRTLPTLLAGRRIVDSPKTAWRSVGGVALATFVAGLVSLITLVGPSGEDAADRQLFDDLRTGGFLTLAIAGVLAGVSTGVLQAGRIIDQRDEYRALRLVGTDLRTLDQARWRETVIPLVAAVGIATAAALLLLLPAAGVQAFTNVHVVVQFVACVVGASALVLAGSTASRAVARAVL